MVALCVEIRSNEGVCVACVSTGKQNKERKKNKRGGVWALKPVGLLGFVWSSKKEKKEIIKSPFS